MKGRFRASRRHSHFANFNPRRPVTYTVFPGGFLPFLGSSPNDMSSLGSRLASLYSLAASCSVSRTRLAQTGFYYDTSKTQRNISNVHEVTCYSCGVSYSQWKDGDKPEQIHERLKPDCPHLRASDGGSISTNNSSSVSTNGSASLTSVLASWSGFTSTSTSLGGRPGLQGATATTARNGQSQGPRMDSAVNRNNTGHQARNRTAVVPSRFVDQPQLVSQHQRAAVQQHPAAHPATWVAQPQQDDPHIDLNQMRFQAPRVAQPQQGYPDIDLDQTRFQDVPAPAPITSAAAAEQAMGMTLRPRVRQILPP